MFGRGGERRGGERRGGERRGGERRGGERRGGERRGGGSFRHIVHCTEQSNPVCMCVSVNIMCIMCVYIYIDVHDISVV